MNITGKRLRYDVCCLSTPAVIYEMLDENEGAPRYDFLVDVCITEVVTNEMLTDLKGVVLVSISFATTAVAYKPTRKSCLRTFSFSSSTSSARYDRVLEGSRHYTVTVCPSCSSRCMKKMYSYMISFFTT